MFLFSLIPLQKPEGMPRMDLQEVTSCRRVLLYCTRECVYNNSIITESEKAIGKKKHWNSAQKTRARQYARL